MTLTDIAVRLSTLEKAVADLRTQLVDKNGSAASASRIPGEDEIIPGAEYPLVLTVPPKETVVLKARIVSVERDRTGLALSDAEWARIRDQMELDDE